MRPLFMMWVSFVGLGRIGPEGGVSRGEKAVCAAEMIGTTSADRVSLVAGTQTVGSA